MRLQIPSVQREKPQALLLKHRHELQAQMLQNQHNLAAPSAGEGTALQRNAAREVGQALTTLDATELVRIGRALAQLADGSHGFCGGCGCAIPLDRLWFEPQTQHYLACKSRWETRHAP